MLDKITMIISKALAENGIEADQQGETFWIDTEDGTIAFTVEYTDANGKEEDNTPVKVSPFSTMTITAEVDWDVDEDEDGELPDAVQTLTLNSQELFFADVLDAADIDETTWNLDEEMLEEYISDKLSDEMGFCHNGFTYTYKLDKGE